MMEKKARQFVFKEALYKISNELTGSDVEKMKFMLSDFLPRQQLEKAKSGFDLLCLMASKSDLLSCDDYSFLEEVMREVGKGDRVRSITLASGSVPFIDDSISGSPQRRKLLQLKKFLAELADDLTVENVRDMSLFFTGVCESINYQNVDGIKSGEELFSRLLDGQLISIGQLQPLEHILRIIGRLDLASKIKLWMPSNSSTEQCRSTGFESYGSSESQSLPEEEQDRAPTFANCVTTPMESLPEEEQDSTKGSTVYILPSGVSRPMESLVEKDHCSSTDQLLLKLEAQERQLEQEQDQLVLLHDKLYSGGDEVQFLRMELERKTSEVKSLLGSITKLQELLWGKNDIPLYEMNHAPHGLAIIISNGAFNAGPSGIILKPRNGASKDSDCFSQTFKYLQYSVQLHFNMTVKDMKSLILTIGNSDHSTCDSFVCCVSSHGDQEGIYGSDGMTLSRKAFIDPIKTCASLQGKPKLFFFQACRVPIVAADSSGHIIDPVTTLHSDSDVLIANASTCGNPAYTSLETGSWFANAIQRKLTDPQLVHTRTLQQLLEEVTDFVSQAAGQLSNGERVSQCVEVTTRMRKGVKFFK